MRTHDNGQDREMTAEEIAEHEARSAMALQEQAAAEAAREAAAAARLSARAKLSALGLTDEEISALIGG
jgi:hypothetical protein